MAYQDPPDLNDLPKTPEQYRDGIYAEVRHIRRMAENVFWLFLAVSIVLALTAGWAVYQFEIAH